MMNFMSLTALGLGNSLGIGIFVLLGILTRTVAGPAVIVSIFISAITSALAGLCFAEFGTRFLNADSAYSYCYSYHGENVSFIFGWALILEFIAGAASIAKGIVVFVDALTENQISNFLKEIVPLNPDLGFPYLDFFSPIIIIVFMISMACGVKKTTIVKNIFTVCSLLLTLSIIIAGSFKADLRNWYIGKVEKTKDRNFFPFGVLGVLKGAAMGFYGFVGFDGIGVTGREISNPQKSIPFATQVTIFIVFMLYGGVAVILSLMLPYTEHDLGAALPVAFEKINWIAFKWIIAVGAFFGFYTCFHGVMTQVPRVIYSMANDGLLFHFLGNKCEKFKTPLTAILISGLLSVIAAGIFNFEDLVNLTVMATLFVSTIVAIDVIMLRYISKSEPTENALEKIASLSIPDTDRSVKQLIKLLFNFNSNTPTKLTEKVVVVNLVVFCASSISLAVVFKVFPDYLADATVKGILSTVLLLMVMLLAMASMACQPKSQELSPFKAPLVPIVPCFSIFLNILMMILLGSLTMIFFLIWMIAGIIPHLLWFCFKYLRGNLRNDSLFEINKLNSVKLNESIWNINLNKKAFYEGAVNPVFEEDEIDEVEEESGKDGEKIGIEEDLKQSDGVKVVVEKPQENNIKSVVAVTNHCTCRSPIFEHSPVKDESVQWECVAEIHTEEFAPENYELQIVDNTYYFLSNIIEDMPKDEVSAKKNDIDLSEEHLNFSQNSKEVSSNPAAKLVSSKTLIETQNPLTNDDLEKDDFNSSSVEETEEWDAAKRELKKSKNSYLEVSENKLDSRSVVPDKFSKRDLSGTYCEEPSSSRDNLLKKKKKNFSKKQEINLKSGKAKGIRKKGKTKASEKINVEEKMFKLKSDEHLKNFKEKLNMILKNQINMNGGLSEAISKDGNSGDESCEDERNKRDDMLKIRTLNKSQIKNKLEILLAKGPPKRSSLKNSFNIKLEADNETLKQSET